MPRRTIARHRWRTALPPSHDLLQQFAARPGILGHVLRTDEPFRRAFAAFLTGEKRALLIAGEPGNGKSTLLCDIIIAHRELADFPLAGIAYDAVHGLFFDCLGLPLPRGETYPPARELVSGLLRDTILHALEQLPPETRLLIETPLIGGRGETALEEVVACGHTVQAVVLHNPHVWRRVMAHGERDSALAAQADAMLAIRSGLAAACGVAGQPPDVQEQAIEAHWHRWAKAPHRLVVSWNGPASDAAAAVTDAARIEHPVPGNGLFPPKLATHACELASETIAQLPNLPAFRTAVRDHNTAM